jgi:glycosyltransferase involved in cell wall biosynthesis
MNHYLLTVVTICYNDIKGLRKTISSYPLEFTNIEYIVIDGGSTDGSTEYLKSLRIRNLSWISESDNGIYDAMNKGIKISNGEYIIFMNSGDRFYSLGDFSKIINALKDGSPDILFGDTMMVDYNYKHLGLRSVITTRSLPNSLNFSSMKQGMLVCHQSFIVIKEIAPNYIEDNLSADIDWQIKSLKKATNVQRYNGIIAEYLVGGTSQQRHLKSLLDRFTVMKNHFGLFQTIYSHCYFIYRAFVFRLTGKRKKS